MRKLILAGLMAAALAPMAASAQTGELRRDRADIRHAQVEAREDYYSGAGRREMRENRRDIRDARREYREDWRDYRRSHPDVYRGGAWAGPRGYAYRPVDVGYRFRPDLYDRRYWIDPYRYHLAPAPRYTRWVRYGPDVVRVDVRTGRVLDVHRGFFF